MCDEEHCSMSKSMTANINYCQTKCKLIAKFTQNNINFAPDGFNCWIRHTLYI